MNEQDNSKRGMNKRFVLEIGCVEIIHGFMISTVLSTTSRISKWDAPAQEFPTFQQWKKRIIFSEILVSLTFI